MAKYISKPFGFKSSPDRQNPDKTQIAAAYDILSEGEIEGLANGFASVFVNDIPVIDTAANEIIKNRQVLLSTTASSNSVSHAQIGTIGTLSNNNLTGLSLGPRYILIEGAAKKGTGIASATVNTNTVTTSSSFFTSTLITTLKSLPIRGFVRVSGAGPDGTDLITAATFVSATEITTAEPIATTVSSKDISIDLVTKITNISGTTATLNTTPGVTLTNAKSLITGADVSQSKIKNLHNIENLQFGLTKGTLGQSALNLNTSFGQASVIASPNIQLEQNNLRANIGTTGNLITGYNNELDEPSQSEGTAADTVLTSAVLDVSNPSEVDEIHLTFNLPACHALKSSSGAKGPSFVELQIFFEYSTDGGASYISELAFGPSNNDILTRPAGGGGRKVNFFSRDGILPNNGYIKPRKEQYAAFVEEFVLDVARFQPYDDWRIRVRRINDLNFKDGSFRHNNNCTLQTVESIVKDKLSFPHTAYAFTSFNAKDYEGRVPDRTFTLKGMKIQVPTNYLTRDETGGAAAYTRNVSSGAVESTYQNWDGNFRGDVTTFNQSSVNHKKVFCDNPVWVFYDMVVNERYGMGQFIDKNQIDKYQLFRLAKYCDEEVPDGNGGYEPRFTTNVYLTKAAEATNVLKQFASVFRGMNLWMDGQLTAIADQPKEPVYTFTKANVKDGVFSYEGTSQRIQTNQIKVTWNDPQDNYRQSTEYVEDYESIAESGRIIRSEQLAFGCTSRGQAHRLGKWKLLSEQNEKETVSFQTGSNALVLKPGDIIAVQDADRDRSSFSGRVSNTGTKTTTSIPIDRTINLPVASSDFPHQLLLIYPEGGAYLQDDSATIGGTAYVKGDLIPSITSSTAAANEDANIFWSENVRVEKQPVSTSLSGNITTITTSSAFTSAPEAEVMWALQLFNSDGTEKTGSVKEYKVVSIKEMEQGGEFGITATAFYKNKFAEIERGFALEPRPTEIAPNPEDVVPAPTNIVISVDPMDSSDNSSSTDTSGVLTGNKVTVTWDYPSNSDGSKYRFANGFEVLHDFDGNDTVERVGTVDQSLTFTNISAGAYNVKIRTVSTIGTISTYTLRQIEIQEREFTTPGISRTELLPQGGTSSRNLTIDSSSGLAEFTSNTYTFTNPNGVTFTNSSSTAATYQQSFSGMTTTAYLVFDSSETTDRLKALEIITNSNATPEVTYFAELGASNSGLTNASGTIQLDLNSNQVNGTNTAFSTEFSVGDLVKLKNGALTTQTISGAVSESKSVTLSGSNTNIKVGQTVTGTGIVGVVYVEAKDGTSITLSNKQSIADGTTLTFTPFKVFKRIRGIESDTIMFLEQIVERPFDGSGLQKQSYQPDFTNDSILAKINLDSGTYSIEELYVSAGGEKGDKGPQGPKGSDGPKGDDGAKGQKGQGGSTGDKGAKGAVGDKGPKGVVGDTGDKGETGDKGIKGQQGATGDKGTKGVQGDQGAKGAQGAAGDKGLKGAQGDQGPKGATGDKGQKGGTGEKGETGQKGDQGPKGVTGDTGAKGDTGQKGDQGAKGVVGDQGAKGTAGQKGDQGPKGVVGDQGDKGTAGQKGDQGPKGVVGDQGAKGTAGQKGDQGPKGATGDTGAKGDTGQKGDQGVKGGVGDSGPKGTAGDIGDKGTKGPTGVKGGTGVKGDPGDDVFLIYYDGLNADKLNGNETVDRDNPPLAPDMNSGSSSVSGSFRLTQADGTVTDWYTEAAALSDWYFIATAVRDSITNAPRAQWTVSEYLQGEKGEAGAKGDKGVKGVVGAQGPKGAQGDQGDKGIKGTGGDQGAKGVTGDGGDKGQKGGAGDQGQKGVAGDGGAKGQKGAAGADGEKGATGAGGDKGQKGGAGDQGAKGVTGDGGAKGATGEKGDTGAKGVTGDGGAKGATGAKGDTGAKGVTGDGGPKGAQGDQGDKGIKGTTGEQGAKGDTGQKGDQGAQGQKGAEGAAGDKGVKGAGGDKGLKGELGPKGSEGDAGDKGDPGVVGDKGQPGQVGTKGADGSPGADAPYVVIGFDSTVDTNTERTTAIKTFSGLNVVKVNSVYWDAVSGIPYQNQASEASDPTLTALTGTNALIAADTIVVQDLVLPTVGAKVNGSTIGNFNLNSLRYAEVCDIASGAGFYQGYIRAKGGNGQVKTIHFLFSDGTVNTTVTSGGTDTAELSHNASGVVYKTPILSKLPGLLTESRLTATDDTSNIPLAFTYSGTGTVTLYMYGQGDSNARQVDFIEARFLKFGIATPNQFTFTDQTGQTAGSTVTSNTITLSGSSFVSGTASITGGTYSVNGGTYTSSSTTVSNGDTISLRVTASSTGGATVFATFTVSDTSDTWSVQTTGGGSPPPGGNGGGCSLCCVHESMLIATGEDMKSIYDINIGDMVVSHNFETGQDELTEVTDLIIVERDVDYKVNDLIMTEDHPVYLEDGSKASINPEATLLNYKQEVNKLKVGDKMRVLGGTLEEIKIIERFPGTEKNFAIQTKYNNFYANGILVDSVIRRD